MKNNFELNDNNIVLKECYLNDNYEIEQNGENPEVCIIYFSSNGLYFPNTIEVFNENIICNNRYEWKVNRVITDKIVKREIFVRDIYKQWYIIGINHKISSVDQLVSFLKEQTKDCKKIITVGNSAGGYISTLVGCFLSAEIIFNFSGQFSLEHTIEKNYFLNKYKEDSYYNKYYNITEVVKNSNVDIFYFYPAKVEGDIMQASLIKDIDNVKCFAFDSSVHGDTMYSINLPFLISYDKEKLFSLYEKYKNRIISPFDFSVTIIGFFKTLKFFITDKVKKTYRKYFKKK